MTPFGSPVIGGQKSSPEENSCIPITHFQCKNNFEHLLISSKGDKPIKINWQMHHPILPRASSALFKGEVKGL